MREIKEAVASTSEQLAASEKRINDVEKAKAIALAEVRAMLPKVFDEYFEVSDLGKSPQPDGAVYQA